MKKLSLCFICFASLFIVGCIQSDWSAHTEIEIINGSSYNLYIAFEEISPYLGFNEEIYLLKNESILFYIWTGLGGKDTKPRNPNNEKVKITFLNIDTEEIIKEMENSENMFKFIRSEEYKAYYQFKITDDLLL
jgi:hypothetical protein